MPYTYEYPHPAVTADTIVICKTQQPCKILLVKRKKYPCRDMWALPGGFIELGETLEQSAMRELEEETGLKINNVTQFRVYGNPGRDPRERVITIAFYSFLDETPPVSAGDDAGEAEWFSLNDIPQLAFDHSTIVKDFLNSIMKV